jgi:ubiquitin carboxyl-terminal hydrolase 8
MVEKRLVHINGVCGLRNIGNSCYMNSALQCLNSIPAFGNFFQNYTSRKNDGNHLVQAYANLVKMMWSGDVACTAAEDLKTQLGRYTRTFSDYAQHDAHEFITVVIDILHDELSNGSSSSIMTDQLNISLKSTVKCLTCNISQTGNELMKFLSLPLPQSSTVPVHLSSLLDSFEKTEDLDGEIFCDACQTIAKGQQKTTLHAPLPPIIIVQLKRFPFNGTSRKLETLIDYPYIDFDFERRGQTDNDHLYNLIAISMHSGSLASGHYTAFAWHNPSRKWYHFNDRSYELVNNPNDFLLKREAYFLIYAKKSFLK